MERWASGESAYGPEVDVLEDLVARTSLSPEPFSEMCAALREDILRAPIDTEEDLDLYCARVGGSVGITLAQLFGTSAPEGEWKMATLGTAMQLTNILRDIDEDAQRGRRYIPQSAIVRLGPPVPGAREQLLIEQIARADALYDQGMGAIPFLIEGRRSMALSAMLYREILRQIEREGLGRSSGRVVVPAWRRELIILKCRLRRW